MSLPADSSMGHEFGQVNAGKNGLGTYVLLSQARYHPGGSCLWTDLAAFYSKICLIVASWWSTES